jgi:Tfp pilus assembly protein PilX
MNQPQNPNQKFLQLMLRAQYLARQDSRSDRGYAMVVVSIISIFMFSLLVAYMTITNLTKSSTNAYIDGSNSFYAAESGLNKRAQELRERFVGYSTPTGLSPGQSTITSIVTPANISNCFSILTTADPDDSNDFECRNYLFRYNNNASTTNSSDGSIVLIDRDRNQNSANYIAHTFVADKTNYSTATTPRAPAIITIPAGDIYAGLGAQEYKYTVYSTAKKPNLVNSAATPTLTPAEIDAKAKEAAGTDTPSDAANIATANAKQAAADAANAGSAANNSSVNAVLQMDFKSRIIPLFQFAVFYDDDLEMNSTSRMDITGRVHTNRNFYLQPTQPSTGAGDTTTGTFFTENISVAGKLYNRVDASANNTPGLARMKTGGTVAAPIYTTISPSRGAETTPYSTSQLSGFAGKITTGASGAGVLNPPEASFLRKQNNAGTIGEYYGKADIRLEMIPDRTAVPFDFTTIQTGTSARGTTCAASLNVDPERQNYSTVKCNQFTEGQLRSLQQPVLIMPNSLEEAQRFCDSTWTTWTAPSAADKRTLQALALAVSANPNPLSFDNLKTANATGTLLANLTTLGVSASITTAPDVFARSKRSCFLSAPLQRLVNTDGTPSYFDRRENRWLTMLQTNIQSLTVWNRDGLFVTLNEDKTDRDTVSAAVLNTAFTRIQANSSDMLVSANNLVFVRAAANTTDADLSLGSFQRLGLAAMDRTEGGLVFHATVSDNLDGAGSNDVTYDTTKPIRNKKGDTIAYQRHYPSNATGVVSQSPYAFAISGGINLPSGLTVATDQGIYVQGDYNFCMDNCQNTNAATAIAPGTVIPAGTRIIKTPAAVMADTITVLSNNCQDNDKKLNCGITAGMNQAVTTRINAAFLSYTDKSIGNVDPTTDALPTGVTNRFSGGLNNYMRMAEDWYTPGSPGVSTAIPFVYRGSFVSLGAANEFSGAYQSGGNYYNIPSRDFGFDNDFTIFDKLPPLTPKAIYLQQEVFKRAY